MIEVKFEIKKCVQKLQMNFILVESIILDIGFVLSCTHHKLEF
jgi:hypothetical protein